MEYKQEVIIQLPQQRKELKLIAAGNGSQIYELNQTHALKVVSHRTPHGHRSFCRTLQEDYSSGSILEHPYLLKYYSYVRNACFADDTKACCLIEMERCKTDFYEYFITKESSKKIEIVQAFAQVLSGLAHLHGQGYAHNDIKPENLFLDFQNNARIADFGYTRLHNENEQPATKCALWHARDMSYAAPEIIQLMSTHQDTKHNKNIPNCLPDERQADLFALGQSLFACVFRVYPRKYEFPTIQDPYYTLIVRNDAQALYEAVTQENGLTYTDNTWTREELLACTDLTVRLMHPEAQKRLSCKAALQHKFFLPLRSNQYLQLQSKLGQDASYQCVIGSEIFEEKQ